MNKESAKIDPQIEAGWKDALKDEFTQPYFADLKAFLIQEKSKHEIYPPSNLIFNAFYMAPFADVKVVILGQDPYHGKGQAHGLCFSVLDGVKLPPSLQNIYKELKADLNLEMPEKGNLEHWAKQGVLLLNSVLTVRKGQAGSHQKKGWERFTDSAIKAVSEMHDSVVFILWGNYARSKRELINADKHLVLEAVHPSPFSAYSGFFGCKHFSKTNEFLIEKGRTPIDWSLP